MSAAAPSPADPSALHGDPARRDARQRLIRGGRVVDPSQNLDARVDVLIEDGVVSAIAPDLTVPSDAAVTDATGLVVTPGLIDMHVHLREPGQEYKETVATGVDAAAAGGFTGVACMPNTSPVNDSPAITAHILRAAAARPHARVHPIACITQGMAGEALSEYGALQQAGAVALSDDGMPVAHSGVLRRAFQYAQHFDLTVIQHAEDLTLTGEGVMHEGAVSARLGLAGIPSQAEDAMIVRDLMLAEMTGGRYHVAHLATAGGVEAVRAAKARDVDATCEVSPHHLLLTDEAVAASGFDTATKMKPPLRGARDRDALIAGLVDGTIDAIASDHAPHHPNEKEHPFGEAPFGIVGLETTLSLCLDRLVHAGIIDLTRLVALLSTAPARILNLAAGGSLAPGQPADVTLIDLDRAVTVDPSRFRSKGRTTPFAGWTLRGAAVGTLLDGRPVILPPR